MGVSTRDRPWGVSQLDVTSRVPLRAPGAVASQSMLFSLYLKHLRQSWLRFRSPDWMSPSGRAMRFATSSVKKSQPCGRHDLHYERVQEIGGERNTVQASLCQPITF